MRILWAPWRRYYVETVDDQQGCFLCDAASQPPERWRDHLVLHRGSRSFIILNKYPYNSGHLMIVPLKHTGNYEDLDRDTILEMDSFLRVSLKALREVFKPHGFNIGYNIGRPAGAGLETHIHMHVVPRWNGDTNFMPVVGQTKVISQDLLSTYDRLKEVLSREDLWSC
ncbi:MAG: HIT domain-containing protein [Aquificota bacterium]|nr:HIT domain-containing protein [Aquificota bacterium]